MQCPGCCDVRVPSTEAGLAPTLCHDLLWDVHVGSRVHSAVISQWAEGEK